MPVNETVNKILREMWRLDEKLAAGEALDEAEKSFYNSHLVDIAEYYAHNDEYWNNKKIII